MESAICSEHGIVRERCVGCLRARVGELERALQPFADVWVPDSWPERCVVDWRERRANDGSHSYASASYLDVDAQGGPTVGDYRAARAALRGEG